MMIVSRVVLVVVFVSACSDPLVNADDGGNAPDVMQSDAAQPEAGSSDAGADLGPEGLDAGRDVSVRDVGSNPPRGHRPVMRVIDPEPCEAWEPVASPLPPGLPDDATPRVLWTYRPSEDPNYEAIHAHYQERVRTPVISPDGTIWVHGPGYDQISQIDRDGAMLEWFRVGGGHFEDEETSQRFSHMSIAPNGHALVIIFVQDEPLFPAERGAIVSVDPASTTPRHIPSTRVDGLELDRNSRLAVSPDGMVYAISQNRVYGLCQGVRHMWTLTNIVEDGEPDYFNTGHFGGVFVQPDGSLLLSGNFAETYTVTGTEVSTELFFDTEDPWFYRSIRAITPSRIALGAYDFARESGARFDVGVRVDPDDWRRQRTASIFAMNALGELYLLRSDDVPYLWEPAEDVRTPLPPEFPLFQTQTGLADGGWLVNSAESLRAVDALGVTQWTLDQEEEMRFAVGGPKDYIMDDQGVYFAAVEERLTAVQTASLPRPNTMCLSYYGCNPQRDRYLRPESP